MSPLCTCRRHRTGNHPSGRCMECRRAVVTKATWAKAAKSEYTGLKRGPKLKYRTCPECATKHLGLVKLRNHRFKVHGIHWDVTKNRKRKESAE